MRNTALAIKDEYEVPVSSAEVLEANVAAIRDSLKEFRQEMREFKQEVRAAFSSVNSEIKSLYGEVRSLREKTDKSFERMSTKYDGEIKEIRKDLGAGCGSGVWTD